MHGWNDPYDPERTRHGESGKSPKRAPGASSPSSGRHAAPPDWPPAAAAPIDRRASGSRYDDIHRPGSYPRASGRHAAYDRDDEYADAGRHAMAGRSRRNEPVGRRAAASPASPASCPSPPNLAAEEPRRRARPLVLAAIAAAATLLIIVGIAGLLRPAGDEALPTAAPGAGTTAAGGRAGAAGAASVLPSAPPRTAAPANRAVRPAAQPTPTVPPRRTASPAPRPARSTAASTPSSGTSTSATLAQQVVALVNQDRADAGCNPVDVNSKLTTAAQLHSEDQAEHKTMSHDGSDGSTLAQRIDRVGYDWRTIGENVAVGQTTATRVMDAWMDSEGHRQNILNCEFEDIGVGVARDSDGRLHWTQDFGA